MGGGGQPGLSNCLPERGRGEKGKSHSLFPCSVEEKEQGRSCKQKEMKLQYMAPCEKHKGKAYPTTNGGMQHGSSVGIHTHAYTVPTRFCTFGTDLYAQSVLINKVFASFSRKFIKSALLVGYRFPVSLGNLCVFPAIPGNAAALLTRRMQQ